MYANWEINCLDLLQPRSLFLIIINDPYYMAGSANGQDEANPVLQLATRAGKKGLSCPLGIARFGPASKNFFEARLHRSLTLQNYINL